MKPSSPKLAHATDVSERRSLLLLSTFVTLGSVASSIVIGAWRGTPGDIATAVLIAGAISLPFWVVTLPLVVLMSIPDVLRFVRGGITRRSPRTLKDVSGVTDEWLDGPA